jgi:chemosensory pili system protein ChpA (sensor histidine kinase/response regulator)
VAHGIEECGCTIGGRKAPLGPSPSLHHQESNDVSVEFSDDGSGLNLERIRAKAVIATV